MKFNFKALRRAKGLTLERVSALSGYSVATINGLEIHDKGSQRLRGKLLEIYGNKKQKLSPLEPPTSEITPDQFEQLQQAFGRLDLDKLEHAGKFFAGLFQALLKLFPETQAMKWRDAFDYMKNKLMQNEEKSAALRRELERVVLASPSKSSTSPATHPGKKSPAR